MQITHNKKESRGSSNHFSKDGETWMDYNKSNSSSPQSSHFLLNNHKIAYG